MLNWLKGLFGGARASEIVELKARLVALDGSPVHGEAEYEAWDNGDWELDIEVEGPDGGPAPQGLTVLIDGHLLGELFARGDDAELKRASRRGHDLPSVPVVGSLIEVHGPHGVLLSGRFEQDH